MMNLLAWAIQALILNEDEARTAPHKERHSRTAGLSQRLAAAERGAWEHLIERAYRKLQEDEDRGNLCSNQLEGKEQAFHKKVNRAIYIYMYNIYIYICIYIYIYRY